MSMDLNDFDQRIQEEVNRLSDNLKQFSELQEKAQYSKDAFDKASQSLRELESEIQARVDKYDKQFSTILREVNMRMEELSFLRDKLSGAQRDFTAFAGKRIQDHKEAVDNRVDKVYNEIKDFNESLRNVYRNIDTIKDYLESPQGLIGKLDKRVRFLMAFSWAASLMFIVLVVAFILK